MARKASKVFTVAGLIGLALAPIPVSAGQGRAVTKRTPSLTAPAGGYLYCRVIATSTGPIGIIATIVDAQRTNVTAYGTGFRASPEATDDGRYYAEETAGTVVPATGRCRAEVTGARRPDIVVTLTAFGPNGEEVDRNER
jgi:hypothetical protein